MARKLIPQVTLGDKNDPPGWNGGNDEMTVVLAGRDVPGHPGQLQFIFKVSTNFPYSLSDNPLEIEIQRDCTIIFRLDKALNSRWSDEYYFITGKKAYKNLYGDVVSVDDQSFSIKAKYNEQGQQSDRQRINLSIDYGQSQDMNGTWRYLPIMIDPDVGNPRPNRADSNEAVDLILPLVSSSDE